MDVEQKIASRFRELAEVGQRVRSDGDGYLLLREWHSWVASAIQLVTSVFSPNSPHSRVLLKCSEYEVPQSHVLDQALGAFDAAESDFQAGIASNFRAEVAGEILGDFVRLSKAALAEGSVNVAAVLASAALEDALKRFARQSGLKVDDADMQQVVNALKGAGLVAGAQKSSLDTMPKIRDWAMHANWDKLTASDVGSVIGFVEQFIVAKFS